MGDIAHDKACSTDVIERGIAGNYKSIWNRPTRRAPCCSWGINWAVKQHCESFQGVIFNQQEEERNVWSMQGGAHM